MFAFILFVLFVLALFLMLSDDPGDAVRAGCASGLGCLSILYTLCWVVLPIVALIALLKWAF